MLWHQCSISMKMYVNMFGLSESSMYGSSIQLNIPLSSASYSNLSAGQWPATLWNIQCLGVAHVNENDTMPISSIYYNVKYNGSAAAISVMSALSSIYSMYSASIHENAAIQPAGSSGQPILKCGWPAAGLSYQCGVIVMAGWPLLFVAWQWKRGVFNNVWRNGINVA